MLGDESYLAAALRAGELVWQRGLLKKGPGLCHGVAGNAYALARLYKATQVTGYLRTHGDRGVVALSEAAMQLSVRVLQPAPGALQLYARLRLGQQVCCEPRANSHCCAARRTGAALALLATHRFGNTTCPCAPPVFVLLMLSVVCAFVTAGCQVARQGPGICCLHVQ